MLQVGLGSFDGLPVDYRSFPSQKTLLGVVMVVEEMEFGKEDIEKLRCALPGLCEFYLALVWEFAEYLLKLQVGLEDYEKAKQS